MSQILFYSNTGDEHADIVEAALLAVGSQVVRLNYDTYPADSVVEFTTRQDAVSVRRGDIEFLVENSQVVWNRRAGPTKPSSSTHEDDVGFVARSSKRLLDDLRLFTHPGSTWVNDRLAQIYIESKPNQLRLAAAAGFRIPDTLITNDYSRLLEFSGAHKSIIMKPLVPHEWKLQSGSNVVLSTVVIPNVQDIDPQSVTASPMIYQEKIEKAFELRVVVFGSEVLCVKLNSQDHLDSMIDWRYAPSGAFLIEEVPCGALLKTNILTFMRSAGILHGSLDLAITHEGEAIFFEVNEQGQTLWIEEMAPEIKVLDRTCEFLLAPHPGHTWSGRGLLSVKDFSPEEIKLSGATSGPLV